MVRSWREASLRRASSSSALGSPNAVGNCPSTAAIAVSRVRRTPSRWLLYLLRVSNVTRLKVLSSSSTWARYRRSISDSVAAHSVASATRSRNVARCTSRSVATGAGGAVWTSGVKVVVSIYPIAYPKACADARIDWAILHEKRQAINRRDAEARRHARKLQRRSKIKVSGLSFLALWEPLGQTHAPLLCVSAPPR